ncbi:DUF4269 domain-containing protein [Alkalibacillus aidingensis]|uniref:DUF4269 domain-containing protein n=1 Tax=Alkalibacillus aidingensis TaxID=2747607 RepID=UPI0016606A5E|nr:DUF4269 domain-containing protein [Alkalibacillus aidingensis]
MINTIEYLKSGTKKQKRAYQVITQLNILDDLPNYQPTLCGTIPLGIDVEDSDLDVIMEADEFGPLETQIKKLYGNLYGFQLKKLVIRELPVLKANFFYEGFEFELFAQEKPVHKQFAYLHMKIQKGLLEKFPWMQNEILRLKKQGMKTEPAFCEVLGIKGDPYIGLLQYGQKRGMITYW